MTPKLADYIAAGRALDAKDRLEAAHQLLLSVDRDEGVDDVDVDVAWSEVVERRVHEIVNGTAELVDGREAHAQVRAEIATSRK